jgi:membrane-associated phospholipid phosphatase
MKKIDDTILIGRSTLPSGRQVLAVSFGSAAYLILSALLIGYKTDQLFLTVLFNVLFYLSAATRRFILAFLVFIIFWVIFDSMKAFPNYNFNAIHIRELYQTEKSLFGIGSGAEVLTPNEYAEQHASVFLDVLAGLFYINWIPVPLLLGFYLFRKNKAQFLQFSLAFLFVNLLGFVVYYVYPAAPPWYVQQYGFDVHFNTPGNTAGLARFDACFGVPLFQSLYAKSSNVFAAMPSLHSAYPVIVLYFGVKNRLGLINLFFAVFMLGIWFSAVYSGHHYVLDVLAGITCALTGLLLFDRVLLKRNWFRKFLFQYGKLIS